MHKHISSARIRESIEMFSWSEYYFSWSHSNNIYSTDYNLRHPGLLTSLQVILKVLKKSLAPCWQLPGQYPCMYAIIGIGTPTKVLTKSENIKFWAVPSATINSTVLIYSISPITKVSTCAKCYKNWTYRMETSAEHFSNLTWFIELRCKFRIVVL